MSFVVSSLPDPESVQPVLNPHCVLTESHICYTEKKCQLVVLAWRSAEAHKAGKNHFAACQINFTPEQVAALLEKRANEALTLIQEIEMLEELCRSYMTAEMFYKEMPKNG